MCDESKALLKALSAAFTHIESVKDYINACMSSLLHGTEPPKCFLRVDRSHFVKNTTRKIKYRDFRKQRLFRGVFGYLIQCNSFSSARNIILDFFTVILNENDGDDELGVPLPSEKARIRLFTLCCTHNESDAYASDSDSDENIAEEMNFNADLSWIDDIINEVPITKSETYHQNVFFSGTEKKMCINLLSTIVLWSNIMNQKFESSAEVATSSDVESYFKSLKTGVLGRKMHRADDFLEGHVEFVNAEIKLNAISNNKPELKSPMLRRSNSFHERSPTSGKMFLQYSIRSVRSLNISYTFLRSF